MRNILIPHQQDLCYRYEKDGVNEPMIINQRFVDWVNDHDDMIASVIPYDDKYIDYIKETDDNIGVVLPGGEDIGLFPERDEFELKLIRACYDADVPLFGICKGMQIINQAFGGTMSKHEEHWQEREKHVPTHSVEISHDGIFAKHLVKYRFSVNSFHNWSIEDLGEGLEVCGWSEGKVDRVPEALIVKGKPMAAVQWHPSFMIDHYISKALLDLFYDLPSACEEDDE